MDKYIATSKGMDQPCNCIGPKNGDAHCPCLMIRIADLGGPFIGVLPGRGLPMPSSWERLYGLAAEEIKNQDQRIKELEAQIQADDWIRCDKELPLIGLPVLAISHYGSSPVTPRIVCRLDTDRGWVWSTAGNKHPFYAENQACFKYWKSLPQVPKEQGDG